MFRLRTLRPFDQLLVAILCVSIVYILFNINTFFCANGNGDVLIVETQLQHDANMAARNPITRLNVPQREAGVVVKKVLTDEDGTSDQSLLALCPQDPPNLIGSLACDCDPVTAQYLITFYPEITGGRHRPHNCRPQERTAIIIPFRNRHNHLHTLLRMLLPVLSRQNVDATFIVVEQTEPALFNRPALLNIGYLEARKLARFDCFIFHDVDLVPLNDKQLYRCHDKPHHLAASIKFGRWVPITAMPQDYVGGVMAFRGPQYELINGNSNLYFGEGTDDLNQRITNKNLTSSRDDPTLATYIMLFHDRQENLRESPEREEIMKSARRRQDVEGLKTSRYKVLEVTAKHLYVWVKVSINMTEVFRTAPAYTLRDIRRALIRAHTA